MGLGRWRGTWGRGLVEEREGAGEVEMEVMEGRRDELEPVMGMMVGMERCGRQPACLSLPPVTHHCARLAIVLPPREGGRCAVRYEGGFPGPNVL